MKTNFLILLIVCSLTTLIYGQKAIFLHHSTGGGVYSEGHVAEIISEYNAEHSTSYQVDEFNYPDNPYPWENYPYDYWKLWVDGRCSADTAGIECLESILSRYDIVIFKHCFPGANIGEDGVPDITSSDKTLANYKLQYRALLDIFDLYPEKKFVVWTLTPQHRNATNTDEASRAREFVNWVKNSWLNEDGNAHPNVFIFDFFNIVAESNLTPANGQVNCLKYEYEGDHDGSDGHPNEQANIIAGEAFANFMIQLFSGQEFTKVSQQENSYFNIYFDSKQNKIKFYADKDSEYRILIAGIDGREYLNTSMQRSENSLDISFLSQGI
jgi:hypothetical protein